MSDLERLERIEEAAREAYEIARQAPELNPSNYDDAEARALSDAMCQVYRTLGNVFEPKLDAPRPYPEAGEEPADHA